MRPARVPRMRLSLLVHRPLVPQRLRVALLAFAACAALSCDPIPPPPPSADIVVTVDGAAGASVVLLYSGMREGSCARFEPYTGPGPFTILDAAFAVDCPVEIDVFAPGRSAVAMGSGSGVPPWFTAALITGTLGITLQPPTKLPVTLWLVAAGADVARAEALRDRIVERAYSVLDAVGTGFTLDTVSYAGELDTSLTKCGQGDAISTSPTTYDASRINIYLVKTFGNTTSNKAETCYRDEHREIVFVSWDNENVTAPVLAHELGHVLGLIRPPPGSHTYLVPGFGVANYMAQYPEILEASIGQLYVMNFSDESWVNQSGNPLLRPVVRTCQDSWSGPGDCPRLDLYAAGWP